jgi:DNA-binding NarL/FixJ family response regulator
LIRSVIIEDETLFRKLLQGFLETDDRFEILGEARDGELGLELCLRLKPDLVLLDLGIPEISGEQLAEALLKELPNCRVLVVSADDDPSIVKKLADVGVKGFVHKKQDPEDLMAAISAVAAGETYFDGCDIEEQEKVIRTLIIEDETLMRILLGATLRADRRFQIIGEAEDGEEGLRMCLEKKPDLVLLDVLLPKMRGPELAEKVLKALPKTRIVVVSARQEAAMIRGVLKKGVHGYVDKRQDAKALKNAILEVAKGNTYFSESAQKVLDDMDKKVDLRLGPSELSKRELEILELVARGLTTKEITTKLFVSEATIKTHRYNLMRKLDIHDVAGLTRFAFDHGLLLPE